MRYVHLDTVESGHYLGKTIFNSNGVVMLSEGVQLTVYMITTLRRIGVTMLYIKDPNFEDVIIEDVLSEETKQFVMRQMDGLFQTIRSGKDFNPKNISTSIDKLLEEVMRNQDVLVQLTDIRTHDNDMYLHGINVCMMSVLTGLSMGLNQFQLKELAIGALLHDIGKMELTTDDHSSEPMLHHTWRGFELLKQKREYSLLIAHVAFQHHEHFDGTGVPRQLTSDQIHQYAKIVAVANCYDNLLFDKTEGVKVLPHDACEKMMAMSDKQLDRDVLIQFFRMVSIYPTGASVRLTTKETGVVVGQHRGLPGRPIVRVIKQEGDRDFDVKEMDLAKQTTVFIETVLA